LSLTAAGLATLYFFLAISTHFVLLGIAPALMCVRAFQRKEQLAPLALVAAIVAIGTAIVFFR
jgi:cytochrome c biogenesis protein CcdA